MKAVPTAISLARLVKVGAQIDFDPEWRCSLTADR
jgi:hypothetical protein